MTAKKKRGYSAPLLAAIQAQYPDVAEQLTAPAPPAAPQAQRESRLEQRFNAVLSLYGWQAGECRRPCSDPRSRANTGTTTARANCLVMWHEREGCYPERVRFIGWLWEIKGWTYEQIRALVHEEEQI